MIHNIEKFCEIYEKMNHCKADRFLYHFEQQFEGIECVGKKILDIGCGKGLTSVALACLMDNVNVTAIDEYEGVGHNKENYEIFEKTLEKHDIKNVNLSKMDFLKNDFQDGEFDIIVANHSLHHIIRTNKYISNDRETEVAWIALFEEIKRILNKKGILIIKEGTRSSIWRILPIRLKFIDWEIHPTKREFIKVIKKIFWGNIEVENVVNYRLQNLAPILRKNPLFTFFITPEFYIRIYK